MSDTHQEDNGDGTFAIALHYPVPDILNDVGMNYRDALVASGIGLLPDGRRTILVDINPAEEFLLDTGELYEHRLAETSILTQVELEALYSTEQSVVFEFLSNALGSFLEMASYIDLFELRSDSVLINRIAVAVTIKAQNYVDGATPSSDQLTWASRVLNAPRPEAEKLLHYLVALNHTATIPQITGVDDPTLQIAVDAGVDAFVAGGITNGAA